MQREFFCIDCKTRAAVIRCCRDTEKLCLIHAHATKHAAHPSLWTILDQAKYKEQKKEVDVLLRQCVSSVERDLRLLEEEHVLLESTDLLPTIPPPAAAAAAAAATVVLPPTTSLSDIPMQLSTYQDTSSSSSSSNMMQEANFYVFPPTLTPPTAVTTTGSTSRQPTFESIRKKSMQEARLRSEAASRRQANSSSSRRQTQDDGVVDENTRHPREEEEVGEEEDKDDDEEGEANSSTTSSRNASKNGRSSAAGLMFRLPTGTALATSSLSASSPSATTRRSSSNSRSVSNNNGSSDAWIIAAQRTGIRGSIVATLYQSLIHFTRVDAETRSTSDSSLHSSSSTTTTTTTTTDIERRSRNELLTSNILQEAHAQRFSLDIEEALFRYSISSIVVGTKEGESNPVPARELEEGEEDVGITLTTTSTPTTVSSSHHHGQQHRQQRQQRQQLYRDKSRQIVAALRNPNNVNLRMRIVSGTLAPVQLVGLSSEELLPEAVRTQRAEVLAEEHRRAFLDEESSAGGWFQAEENVSCPSCRQKGCTMSAPMNSGSRDIRKAEIWGTSNSDEVLYKSRCTKCGHSWASSSSSFSH